jgi:hypothetical protein
MRYVILSVVFVLASSWAMAQAYDPYLAAAEAKVIVIRGEAEDVIATNNDLRPKSRLPVWVIDAMKRIVGTATAALDDIQRVAITGTGAQVGCTGSSPKWASSADYASVNTCVSGATAGDTITVSGNATWTSTLTFTRGVNLVGSGTPIITGQRNLIYWTPDSAARTAHDTLKITGFTFDGNNATSADTGSTGLIRVASTTTDYVNLVITNNTLKNTAARGLYFSGRIYGVMGGNTFDRIGIILSPFGGDVLSWDNETQAYGVAQNFYVEDNLIQWSSDQAVGFTGWIESGNGGRVVVRYNTWDFTNLVTVDTNIWDAHGLQSMQNAKDLNNCGYDGYGACDPTLKTCQQHSTMVSEYYGNKLYNSSNAAKNLMSHRGGWQIMFNNTYVAASGTSSLYYSQYSCDSCADTGTYTQHVDRTYNWGNFSGTGSTRMSMTKNLDFCESAVGSPYTITANRDYFTDVVPTFDGTSGVGAGTLAARPATCTAGSGTGVGYWATDQSTTDMSTQTGRNPSTPISGTLYRCSATNTWTAEFTPYTYPHPSR